MGAKRINYQLKKMDKEIEKLIARHGRVRVIFAGCYYDSAEKKLKHNNDMRRRVMTKDGKSSVSYKGADYEKWSGYSTSCFVDNASKKPQSPKEVIKLMRKHDGSWLMPIEIQYGWFYRKKVKLYEE